MNELKKGGKPMNSVIKGASYVLVHTPDMVLYNGTTQTTERIVNPDSEYLKEVPKHLRSYEDAVAYWPNQTYIGNVHPDELSEVEFHGIIRKRKAPSAMENMARLCRRKSSSSWYRPVTCSK